MEIVDRYTFVLYRHDRTWENRADGVDQALLKPSLLRYLRMIFNTASERVFLTENRKDGIEYFPAFFLNSS